MLKDHSSSLVHRCQFDFHGDLPIHLAVPIEMLMALGQVLGLFFYHASKLQNLMSGRVCMLFYHCIDTELDADGNVVALPPGKSFDYFKNIPLISGVRVSSFVEKYESGQVPEGAWGTYALLHGLVLCMQNSVKDGKKFHCEYSMDTVRHEPNSRHFAFKIVGFYMVDKSTGDGIQQIGKVTGILTLSPAFRPDGTVHERYFTIETLVRKEVTRSEWPAGSSSGNVSAQDIGHGRQSPMPISFERAAVDTSPVPPPKKRRKNAFMRPGVTPLQEGNWNSGL
jgi:hypothetical protein